MSEYLEDLVDDLRDIADDFIEHVTKKPSKRHKKVKKRLGKKGRPAYALAERIRGVIYVVIGSSIIYAAIIASTEGIKGLTDIISYLIGSWPGRLTILFIGIANLVYGVWKLVMGCD
jgi:hypothetical protein